MNIAILDDYAGVVPTLRCFSLLEGHSVEVIRDPVPVDGAIPPALLSAEVIVPMRERTRFDDALLARLPNLRLISQTGPVPHIDLEACTRRGVLVSSGAGAHGPNAPPPAASLATAELTWGLILAATRNIVGETTALKQGRWVSTPGRTLRGRTLGILGYGQIGAQVAIYGKAFGMRVIAWGRAGSTARAQADGVEVAASREALFEQSDVLALHLRLGPETRGNVTAEDFARMKPDALFVNTSRAELVARGALEAALRTGRPGFAALDVFEQEPTSPQHEPLIALDNTLCTPHLGYAEREVLEGFYKRSFEQVLAYAAGKPVDVRNPEVLAASA